MNITTVGINLAKSVFQVHGVDAGGKVTVRMQLKRSQLVGFFAQLAPCPLLRQGFAAVNGRRQRVIGRVYVHGTSRSSAA